MKSVRCLITRWPVLYWESPVARIQNEKKLLLPQVLTLWMVVSPVEVVPDVISEETYFNLLCFCRLMYYINSASPISYIKTLGDILNIHWNPRPTGHQPHPLQHHELQVPRRLQAARPPHVLPLQEAGDARTEHLQQDVLQVRPSLV